MKILITGASGGLGLELATSLAAAGHTVIGTGRRDLKTNSFSYCRCDLRQPEEIKKTFLEIIKSGPPDAAIFCAGAATDDMTEENPVVTRVKHNFDDNLFGTLAWLELLLPEFRRRGGGKVFAVSSMSIYRENHRNRIGYSAAKLALNKTMENLRPHFTPDRVSFTVLNLGRMNKQGDWIGISYAAAARKIIQLLTMPNPPATVNIPVRQYLLTRCLQWLPDALFNRYVLK